ncbi:MAG: penicillin-binding protein, partial [Bryocella sp.]
GNKETGAKAALPMWIDFMKVAVAAKPSEKFATYTAPRKQLEVPVTPDADLPAKPAQDDDSDSSTPPSQPAAVPPLPKVIAPDESGLPAKPSAPHPAGTTTRAPAVAKPVTASPVRTGTSKPPAASVTKSTETPRQ